MDTSTTITRSWQDQELPAPLLPAQLAETLALGILRQQPYSAGAVAAGPALVRQTLGDAGIETTVLLLSGPSQLAGPDVLYLTDSDGVARFDALLAQALSEPTPVAEGDGTWLRERALAAARRRALSPPDHFVVLPQLDADWLPPRPTTPPPRLTRWLAQALPLPLVGLALLDAYIWNAGRSPALWPLLALPLLGAVAFGWLLFRRLSAHRRQLALAWLARPTLLRPHTVEVARALARRPWRLLYLPPMLLLGAFATVILLLATTDHPTLGTMLLPVGLALLLQLGLSWWHASRYISRSRELVQGLPSGLLPASDKKSLWQDYLYYY